VKPNPTYHPEIRVIHFKPTPDSLVKALQATSQADRAAKVRALRAEGAELIGERE